MGLPSHSQKLWSIIVPFWKNFRDKSGEEPEESEAQNRPKLGYRSKEAPRPDIITEAVHKNGHIMTALQNTQQAPVSSMQIFAPNQWTEAADHRGWVRENLEEAEEEGNPIRASAVTTNLDSQDISDTEQPNQAAYTSWYEAFNIYPAEDCWVWAQSEKMHVTLKRLEAPGSGEVWWSKGWVGGGILVETGGWEEIWGVKHSDGGQGGV